MGTVVALQSKPTWVEEVLSFVADGEASFWKAAVIVKRQMDGGMTQPQIARELDRTTRWVRYLLHWLKEKKNATPDVGSPASPPRGSPDKKNATPDRNTPWAGKKKKKKAKAPKSPAPHPEDLIQEPCPDCATQEEFWQRSLSNLAGDAISMRAFWTRQFGDWGKFKVTSDLVTLAQQAAEVWKQVASELAKREKTNGPKH